MLRLNLSGASAWHELVPGVRVLCAPVTTAIMAEVRRDPAVKAAVAEDDQELTAIAVGKAIARRVVDDWEGVGDESGEPVSVTPEGIDALLDISPVFEAFQVKIAAPGLLLDAEKNGSALSLPGGSAGATGTAPTAQPSAKPARSKSMRR